MQRKGRRRQFGGGDRSDTTHCCEGDEFGRMDDDPDDTLDLTEEEEEEDSLSR